MISEVFVTEVGVALSRYIFHYILYTYKFREDFTDSSGYCCILKRSDMLT